MAAYKNAENDDSAKDNLRFEPNIPYISQMLRNELKYI